MNKDKTQNPQGTDKRPYERPALRVIDLAADEVLAIGCKTVSGGNNVGGTPCTLNNCSNIGS